MDHIITFHAFPNKTQTYALNPYRIDKSQMIIHQSWQFQPIQSIPCPWDTIPRKTSNQDKISPIPPTLDLPKTILLIQSFLLWFSHLPSLFFASFRQNSCSPQNMAMRSLIRTVFPPWITNSFGCLTTQEILKAKLFWKKLSMDYDSWNSN